jgi:hypothetical protein
MPPAPPLAAPALPFAPIWRVVGRLADYATSLYTTLTTPDANPPSRNPAAAANRALNAFFWLVALATTLAGDRDYLPIPQRERTTPTAPPRKRAFRPYNEDARARDQRRRIRHAFKTLPLNVLAERIALRLGLTPADDLWPRELADLTQTPAALFANNNAPLGDNSSARSKARGSAPGPRWGQRPQTRIHLGQSSRPSPLSAALETAAAPAPRVCRSVPARGSRAPPLPPHRIKPWR